jgi:hypothetical protein
MTLDKITEEAVALSETERARLAASLLDTLPPPGIELNEQDIDRREQEMDNGSIEPISHEELLTELTGLKFRDSTRSERPAQRSTPDCTKSFLARF